jgi:hypothetical protein
MALSWLRRSSSGVRTYSFATTRGCNGTTIDRSLTAAAEEAAWRDLSPP